MFDIIQTNKERYGIASYGVSITTMEEVFLQVGAQEDEELELLLAGRNLSIENLNGTKPPNGTIEKVDPNISLTNTSIERAKVAIQNSRQTPTKDKMTECVPLTSVSLTYIHHIISEMLPCSYQIISFVADTSEISNWHQTMVLTVLCHASEALLQHITKLQGHHPTTTPTVFIHVISSCCYHSSTRNVCTSTFGDDTKFIQTKQCPNHFRHF